MKLLKRFFDFYLDASIHVALSVFSLLHITSYFLNISAPSNHLSFFVFFGTICCYNFIKYGVEAKKYILVANRYHKNIQFASFIALGLALYHLYFLSWDIWRCLMLLLVLTALYAVPVLPKAKNLRNLGGIKIFIVAMVWAGLTVALPVLEAKASFSVDVWIELLQRFILVVVLMIPFEVRDLKYDAPELRTLPQRFGITFTNFIGATLTLVFFFVTFLKVGVTTLEAIAKGLIFLTFGILMLETKKNQKPYFASFWVESIPIVWWGVIWMLGNWF